MAAPDYEAIGKRLLAQAEASAQRTFANAEAQMERMLALNQPAWLRPASADPWREEQAKLIAGQLLADPDLKAKVLALIHEQPGTPADPGTDEKPPAGPVPS